MEIFLGRCPDNSVLGKDHDAGVVLAYPELVLGADHAEGLDPADLGLLDLEVPGKDGADPGEEDLLAGGHVGGAANHGHRLRGAVIHLGDMEMVRVRVWLALEDLGHHDSGQSSGNLLRLLYGIDLDADVGHRLGHTGGSQVKLEIIFQPIVRELHNYLFINIFL